MYSNEILASSQAIKGDPIDKPEYPSFIFSLTSDLIQQDIEECINLYEPRAELLGVTVQASPDLHGYNVRILFRTRNQANAVQLDLILSRIR